MSWTIPKLEEADKHKLDDLERELRELKLKKKHKLTGPQSELYWAIHTFMRKGIEFPVQGSRLVVAQNLQNKGLVVIKVKGVQWQKGWYYYVELGGHA